MMMASISFCHGSGVVVSPFAYAPSPGGRIALFGSGETARVGRRVHELLLAAHQKPVPVAVIETPAGFQPNTHVLAQDVKAFFEHSLQNFKPRCDDRAGPPARRRPPRHGRGVALRRHRVGLVRLCRRRQPDLRRAPPGRLAALAGGRIGWSTARRWPWRARWRWRSARTPCRLRDLQGRRGAVLEAGLNLFGNLGLDLAIVPHWNNNEGGPSLTPATATWAPSASPSCARCCRLDGDPGDRRAHGLRAGPGARARARPRERHGHVIRGEEPETFRRRVVPALAPASLTPRLTVPMTVRPLRPTSCWSGAGWPASGRRSRSPSRASTFGCSKPSAESAGGPDDPRAVRGRPLRRGWRRVRGRRPRRPSTTF